MATVVNCPYFTHFISTVLRPFFDVSYTMRDAEKRPDQYLVRAFDLSGGEACHDSQRGGGNGNGETRKAAHLESGARELHTQGAGRRASEGTQGAANRATLSDIFPL